jgi:hypothetical protein
MQRVAATPWRDRAGIFRTQHRICSTLDNPLHIGHYDRVMLGRNASRRGPGRVAIRRPLLAAFAPVMCFAVVACGGPSSLAQSCEWSDTERATVESVPLSDFLGVPVDAGKATCDTSNPGLLSVTASIPDGQDLPDGWEARATVGSWSGKARVAETPNGPMVCYASSSGEWDEVQVRLWASGIVSAEMVKDHDPCDPAAL